MPPIINPSEKAILKINGKQYNHLMSVDEIDNIELTPIDEVINLKAEIEISEDKMLAYLDYCPQKTLKRIISDTYPTNKLDVEVNEVELITDKITKNMLYKIIEEKDISFGIDEEVLNEIILNQKEGKFLIAKGKQVTPPVDETLEFLFENVPEKQEKFNQDEQGRVDYKNSTNYVTCKPGQIVAKINKGTEGESGITIFGDEILPEGAKKINVEMNNSVFVEQITGLIRARKAGRPSMELTNNKYLFKIYDLLAFDNVDLSTGNIRFNGDVEVKGSVMESMEIVAKHSILISENINFSSAYAGNNITVKNGVISSRLYSGKQVKIGNDPSQQINIIIEEVNNLILNNDKRTKKEIEEKNIISMSDKVAYVINTYNSNLPKLIYETISVLKNGDYDVDDEMIIKIIKKVRVLLGNYSAIDNKEYLLDIVNDLKMIFGDTKGKVLIGNISAGYVMNSELYSTGDVKIIGKGSFVSNIEADGNVEILGIVRGGKIISNKNIKAYIVGSESGVKTLLSVPRDGRIQIRIAHTDTVIKIGHLSYRFLKLVNNVDARIKNNKLILQ